MVHFICLATQAKVLALVPAAVLLASSITTLQAAKPDLATGYGKLPLIFEANRGQTDARVKFLARGPGYRLFLTESEAVLSLGGKSTLRVRLEGAAPAPKMTGLDRLPGVSNYFIGRDRSKWRTNIPHYAKVGYEAVYPGIDLVFYGTGQRQLEYDFIVAPGADPSAIKLAFEGAERLEIDENGDLIARLPGGEVRFLKPVIYQEADGARQPVEGGYAVKDGRVTFDLAAYDPAKPLVIDPTLAYATYLGGTDTEQYNRSIAVDGDGNAYVTGRTYSPDFPVVDAFQPSCTDTEGYDGCHDAFVTKLDPTGSALVYSTYLGGASIENGWGIAADGAGNAYVAGRINIGSIMTDDFPTTPGAFQEDAISRNDAFFVKLDATGGLAYGTYLGGSQAESAWDIAIDHLGRAVIGGETGSDNFPTTDGAFDRFCGDEFDDTDCDFIDGDAFLVVIDPAGNGTADLVYSTFLGGVDNDPAFGVAADGAGLAYLTGYTESSDFPTTAGAVQEVRPGSGTAAFLTVIDPSKDGPDGLIYSTYLNGDYGSTIGRDVDIKPGCVSPCRAYLTGFTSADAFPTTPDSIAPFPVTNFKTFVTIIDPDPLTDDLEYSTFFGGDNLWGAWGIAVDLNGNAYISGGAGAGPTRDAIQAENAGGGDAYIAVIDPAGLGLDGGLLFATYLGGTSGDAALAVAVDGSGTQDDPFSVYVTGRTLSRDFPTTAGAFQQEISEAKKKGKPANDAPPADAFIAKIAGPFEGIETVEPLNFRPMAVDDAYGTVEDTQLTVAAPGLLANDTDPNFDPLTVSSNGSPKNGEVTVNPNGSFIYTPNANFFGTDSFIYTASDDGSSKDSATVTIDVAPFPDTPIANDDNYFAVAEGKLIVPASDGVLANDSDPEGESLTAVLVTGPTFGTLTLYSDGSFTYTPGDISGTAYFTYQASDGLDVSDSATVTIEVTVDAADDPPTVAVVNPKEGEYLAGTVTLQADALDDRGINQVEFFVDVTSLGADTLGTDGWSLDWDTTTPSSEGGHTIRAVATDTGGNKASAEVGVTVDNVLPSVAFLTPNNNEDFVSGRVDVSASAADNNLVTRVDFFIDGTRRAGVISNTDVYTFEWNTFEETNGPHTLQATATDIAGNTASTPEIVVEVDNAPASDMHVGDLDGSSSTYVPTKWRASVYVWIDDQNHEPVSDATVNFGWEDSRGDTGTAECTTGSGGNCAVVRLKFSTKVRSVTFTVTVTGVSHASLNYTAAVNHDFDGDSVIETNGTISITVFKP